MEAIARRTRRACLPVLPWYSAERHEFHLPPEKAKALLPGTIETYQEQDGRPLKEILLHARSGIGKEEYKGFLQACRRASIS